MSTNFMQAFLATVVTTGIAAAEVHAGKQMAKSAAKRAKNGPTCTPCAVNARIMDAKTRAGTLRGP